MCPGAERKQAAIVSKTQVQLPSSPEKSTSISYPLLMGLPLEHMHISKIIQAQQVEFMCA